MASAATRPIAPPDEPATVGHVLEIHCDDRSLVVVCQVFQQVDLVDIRLAFFKDGLACKIEQALDDFTAADSLGNNDLEVVRSFGVSLGPFQQITAIGQHGGQRVVDFMCNTRRQPPQRRQLVRLEELQAGLGESCDDGNTAGGDGCSADCTSTEMCGNGVRCFAKFLVDRALVVGDGDGTCLPSGPLDLAGDATLELGLRPLENLVGEQFATCIQGLEFERQGAREELLNVYERILEIELEPGEGRTLELVARENRKRPLLLTWR